MLLTEYFCAEFFSQPWWQGVAGIAQIFAAIPSIVVILQVSRERIDSVAPDWEVHPDTSELYKPNLGGTAYWNAVFLNTGPGLALRTEAFYTNDLTGKEYHIHTSPYKVRMPGERIEFQITYPTKIPSFTGKIRIECQSRYKHKIIRYFTYTLPSEITKTGPVTFEKYDRPRCWQTIWRAVWRVIVSVVS